MHDTECNLSRVGLFRNTKEAPSSIHMQILSWHQQMGALIGPSQSNQLLDASDGQQIHLLVLSCNIVFLFRNTRIVLDLARRLVTLPPLPTLWRPEDALPRHATSVHARGEQRQIQDGRYWAITFFTSPLSPPWSLLSIMDCRVTRALCVCVCVCVCSFCD